MSERRRMLSCAEWTFNLNEWVTGIAEGILSKSSSRKYSRLTEWISFLLSGLLAFIVDLLVMVTLRVHWRIWSLFLIGFRAICGDIIIIITITFFRSDELSESSKLIEFIRIEKRFCSCRCCTCETCFNWWGSVIRLRYHELVRLWWPRFQLGYQFVLIWIWEMQWLVLLR